MKSFPKILLKQVLEKSWVINLGTSLNGFCCCGVRGEVCGLRQLSCCPFTRAQTDPTGFRNPKILGRLLSVD